MSQNRLGEDGKKGERVSNVAKVAVDKNSMNRAVAMVPFVVVLLIVAVRIASFEARSPSPPIPYLRFSPRCRPDKIVASGALVRLAMQEIVNGRLAIGRLLAGDGTRK